MRVRHLAFAACLVLPVAAWADDCPATIQKAEETLAAQQDLDDEMKKEIQAAIDDAKKQKEEGQELRCLRAANQALFLMGAV
jgi:hypothetical protein